MQLLGKAGNFLLQHNNSNNKTPALYKLFIMYLIALVVRLIQRKFKLE